MATCPQCGATLKDEYGMSQCPSCGAFSFVDMNGVAVVAGADAAPEPGGAAAPTDFQDPIEDLIADSPVEINDESNVESSDDSFNHFAPIAELETPASPENAASAEYADAEFQSFDIGRMDEQNNNSAPKVVESRTEPPQRPPRKEADFGPANDPLNLNDFANSEVSSAKDGPLLFRVLISGIDAKEIRESIREVLEDSRFAWDSNEIFSKISKGHLVIGALSPVKASILITRIKRLPVSIRWEQYAITQGPDSETDF